MDSNITFTTNTISTPSVVGDLIYNSNTGDL